MSNEFWVDRNVSIQCQVAAIGERVFSDVSLAEDFVVYWEESNPDSGLTVFLIVEVPLGEAKFLIAKASTEPNYQYYENPSTSPGTVKALLWGSDELIYSKFVFNLAEMAEFVDSCIRNNRLEDLNVGGIEKVLVRLGERWDSGWSLQKHINYDNQREASD